MRRGMVYKPDYASPDYPWWAEAYLQTGTTKLGVFKTWAEAMRWISRWVKEGVR